MALESGTYISDLVATNPVGSDAISDGDGHIRLVKSTVKASFPNVSGAVTATHTELNLLDGVTATTAELNILDGVTSTAAEINVLDGIPATLTATELGYVDGVTSAIQTQLNAKAPIASPTFTGVPAADTASPGTNTTQLATTAFVTTAVSAVTVPVGVWTYLAAATASADATVDFDSTYITSTYDEYMVVMSKVKPATDSQHLYMLVSTDGGSSFKTTGEYSYTVHLSYTGSNISNGDLAGNMFPITGTGTATNVGSAETNELGVSGVVLIFYPTAAAQTHILSDVTHMSGNASPQYYVRANGAAQTVTAEDTTAIRFLFASGNIASGTFRLYGRKKS